MSLLCCSLCQVLSIVECAYWSWLQNKHNFDLGALTLGLYLLYNFTSAALSKHCLKGLNFIFSSYRPPSLTQQYFYLILYSLFFFYFLLYVGCLCFHISSLICTVLLTPPVFIAVMHWLSAYAEYLRFYLFIDFFFYIFIRIGIRSRS